MMAPMSTTSDGIPAEVREAFWADVLEWLSGVAWIHHSDDSSTIFTFRGEGGKEVLAFGPDGWADFVLHGAWFQGDVGEVYDGVISGSAVDELAEALGSKGSPLTLQAGQILRIYRTQPRHVDDWPVLGGHARPGWPYGDVIADGETALDDADLAADRGVVPAIGRRRHQHGGLRGLDHGG